MKKYQYKLGHKHQKFLFHQSTSLSDGSLEADNECLESDEEGLFFLEELFLFFIVCSLMPRIA